MNSVRSYANSYLYTRIPDYERSVFEFVMKADRIDKNADTFTGVIEDVKRRQTSAVLSRVLMRDDVVLCVNNKPLPASFKVFAAKDVRTDQSVKVFIDLSGLITLKNGYYVINKIDIFCSYLLSAMTNIIYNENMTKICSNSMIIQSGTECFVNLSSHIFDYLRANGYSENKNKIAYIFAMYFQCTILGLDRDSSSVKALAAKIADIPSRDINAMELYYDDSVLTNINTLVTCVTDTFKMKGVGTDTFVEKWTWFYGVGTQFGTELFPAFASMITDAYCGAYVNNQKTIEKCCGKAMVNFTTAMLKIGSDTIEVGFRYESTIDREMYDHNLSTVQEELIKRDKARKTRLTGDDYRFAGSDLEDKIKVSIENTIGTSKDKSINAKNIAMNSCGVSEMNALYTTYKYNDTVSTTTAVVAPYLKPSEKKAVVEYFEKQYRSSIKAINENKKITNASTAKKFTSDLKKSIKMLDPSSPVLKETVYDYNDDIKGIIEDCENLISIIDNREETFLNEEDYEYVIEAEGSIADKISSLIDSFLKKLDDRKKEIKEKIAESKRQKVFNKMVVKNLSIYINNYIELENVEDISKNAIDLFDSWDSELIKMYDEVVASFKTEEEAKKSLKNKNYLPSVKKKVKTLTDKVDMQKDIWKLFGLDKKPKKVQVTKDIIDRINKNSNGIMSIYNGLYNSVDKYEHSLHTKNKRGVYRIQAKINDKDNTFYQSHKDILKYENEANEVLCYILSCESELSDKYIGTILTATGKYLTLLDSYKDAINKATDDYMASGKKESADIYSDDGDEDNCMEEIAVAEDGVLICESQKFMGYGGTTKVEKKYNIPEQYCIEREDIMNFKKSDSVVKKAEQAVKKIKDPDDVMKYFKSLFKSLCFWGSITSIEQVKANTNINKIWKLWNSSYKGDKVINPGPTFAAVENILPAGTAVSLAKNGGVDTGNIKTAKGFLSVFKPKKKKKK